MPTTPARRPVRPSAPPGLGARRAALALVTAALARRGGLEDAAGEATGGELEPRDRAFARALALATLRNVGRLDRLLDARLQRAPPPPVRDLLRLGAAQLLVLGTPAFAAVSTTLALAEADRAARPFKGLLNAVLRGLDRDGAAALLDALPPEAAPPAWLAARWRAAWGEDGLRALCARLLEEPPTDLSLRDPAEAAALAEALEAAVLPGPTLRTDRRGDLAEWPSYAEGRWWVQDYAAAWPVRQLDPRPGETALDLCAAPGGKTLQLAAAGARVTALDRSGARLERVAANLARTGLESEVVCADAAIWDGGGRRFDAVLLDAPCTATGTFRRHPDVLWAARPGDVAALAAVQARLLDAAAERVAPGGRLVYCVCSLEPEEGEGQVAPFLARFPGFKLGEAGAPPPGARAAEGGWRLFPGDAEPAGGCDGFFAVRFERAA